MCATGLKMHQIIEVANANFLALLRLRGTYCSLIIHELLLLFISPTTLVFM